MTSNFTKLETHVHTMFDRDIRKDTTLYDFVLKEALERCRCFSVSVNHYAEHTIGVPIDNDVNLDKLVDSTFTDADLAFTKESLQPLIKDAQAAFNAFDDASAVLEEKINDVRQRAETKLAAKISGLGELLQAKLNAPRNVRSAWTITKEDFETLKRGVVKRVVPRK